VSRYFDRIARPEQIVAALPRAMSILTDPAECGPVTLALCQDVQAEAFDYPESFFDEHVWTHRRPQPDADELAHAIAPISNKKKKAAPLPKQQDSAADLLAETSPYYGCWQRQKSSSGTCGCNTRNSRWATRRINWRWNLWMATCRATCTKTIETSSRIRTFSTLTWFSKGTNP